MTAASIDIGSLIVSKPGVNGGRPCITGTGMSVHQVAVLFTSGMSPDSIADEYPGVSVEGVYAAITHYLANRGQIDTEIEDEAADGRAALKSSRSAR